LKDELCSTCHDEKEKDDANDDQESDSDAAEPISNTEDNVPDNFDAERAGASRVISITEPCQVVGVA
jgi:hypothetical protein